MKTIKKFEDIQAWQKAIRLSKTIYATFSTSRDSFFKHLICSASVEVSNNIAEGYGRVETNEFHRFLLIAQGSCFEVKSMVYLAEELEYIDQQKATELRSSCQEVTNIIYGLIKTMRA